MSQHPKYETAAVKLQEHINQLETWLTKSRLKVSPNRSTPTLITSFSKEIAAQPSVTLYNTSRTVNPNLTLLGVNLDPLLAFRKHTDTIIIKAKRRLNVLRALTHQLRTLQGTHNNSIQTVHQASPDLRTLRLAVTPQKHKPQQTTGYKKMRLYARLQAAPKQHRPIMSIKKQKSLNYRATWTWEVHTPTLPTLKRKPLLHYLTHDRPLNRNKWKTPAQYRSNFYNTLASAPRNTPLRAHIHTHFANRSIYSMQPNTILNSYPPPFIEQEKKPSRAKRGSICPNSGAGTTQCCPPTHTGSTLQTLPHAPPVTTQRVA